MDPNILLTAGMIFVLRLVGNTLTTIRLILIMRGQKLMATGLAAIESFIFAIALGSVVTNLDNWWNLAAYCFGFAIGGYLGLTLEQRLIQRFVSIQVISMSQAHDLALAIRAAGYGATESWAQGAEGQHGAVTVIVKHQQVNAVIKIIEQLDPKAFITTGELRGISHGYFRRAMRHER